VELTEKNARVADSENWIPLSYYFCFPSWLCFNYFSSLVVFDTWNICESLHMRVFFFFFFMVSFDARFGCYIYKKENPA
jgi:hypothetical protein